MDRLVDIKETKSCVARCKNKKAPGPDCITYEIFKNLPDNAVDFLVSLFNRIITTEKVPVKWTEVLVKMLHKKGNRENTDNYRPIALANSILKIFTLILNNRLNNFVETYSIIPEYQSGFRQDRSCQDNIFSLNAIIQLKLRKKGGKLFALFVDFKSAFPSIKHNILWKKLHSLGLSTKFINILRNIYSQARVAITNGSEATEFTKISKGLLQGEPTSPLLFALFIADLERYLLKNGTR